MRTRAKMKINDKLTKPRSPSHLLYSRHLNNPGAWKMGRGGATLLLTFSFVYTSVWAHKVKERERRRERERGEGGRERERESERKHPA